MRHDCYLVHMSEKQIWKLAGVVLVIGFLGGVAVGILVMGGFNGA